MFIDTKLVVPLLIEVTGDKQAEVYSKIIPGGLEVTMYWNQLNNRYALQRIIAPALVQGSEEHIGYVLDNMLKEIKYEVGRIYYEN